MPKFSERVRALPPAQRRRFLQLLGVALAAPCLPAAARFAARELAVSEAYAQELETATLFLECDFRDQIDLMHVMVPPSIAAYQNRVVGVNSEQLTMFAPQSELKQYPNGVYLTNDSLELAPHVDTIAMLDTGTPTIGSVHGHEACNGMRSPGHVMDNGASGLQPVWLIDAPNAGQNGAGSEQIYGSTPTPASFHNYRQHRLSPELLNGFAFKGISRAKHSVYHYGAGLPSSELERIASKEALATFAAPAFLPNAEEPALVREILKQVAPLYRKEAGQGYEALEQRFQSLNAQRLTELALTGEEVARWSAGVPAQKCTMGDIAVYDCEERADEGVYQDAFVKAQIWEQAAYASKLFRTGRLRSAALEFDFMDLAGDGSRTENVVRWQAQQVARPLARLIADLKAAGLYERTVIAVYTLDSSRRPAANSYGNDGKNTLILAGGRIKGGYYGDIVITKDLGASGHEYGFRAPDPATGELLPTVTNWGDKSKRTRDGAIWRTVVKAMGIPESAYVGQFHSEVDDTRALDFMLKS